MADEEVKEVQEQLGGLAVAEEDDELTLDLGKKKKKKSKKVEVRWEGRRRDWCWSVAACGRAARATVLIER